MRTRSLIVVFMVLFSSNVFASPWEKFTSEFISLMVSLQKLGDDAEKGYTLGQMAKLHRDILRIERSKEDLIFILYNPEIYKENLSETLSEARAATESARKRLEKIRNRVVLISASASELEQILSDSLRSRKSWLSQVDLSNARGSEFLIKDGEKAVKALNTSRKKLEELLRQTNKN